ncbi:lytic polysaccharide monooxygenase [Vibrio antiquarius]|uniref:lytic polysaccharide monooxygenase n=2 Tax=Vibrio diabolicus subgroup TaxID=2315253 RepID=UPI00080F4267|nr:lytic polysaccharide monooxygenase [Vibrio diabolicus]EHR5764750.1 lytic polysaccharide monooxygenase [Vibrio parahaemolyticus]MCR9549036.1 lytic polysaccharide monooxygenase [Vibrio antiquarius]EHY0932712.1 lytic polysaccharide monooxygenase [Vibrio parahaemolyticus]EIZ0312347.1 lytic polysaccharide monooxygenase [Vibrio parahaemolyticus]EJE8515915.1 lytic polysaccharide monooxygenase [Vibrio parahaemolyticus]
MVNKVNNLLKVSMGLAMLTTVPTTVFAHGWSEFPSARQNICEEQGGIWSGTPPNAACAQAKEMSGTYPFVQKNEYSINITDFNNIEAVKEAIPDGTLCYANDPQKAGMGAPHSGWERTEVKAGTFEYVFNATAPHNPSFWQFYLTKPGADLGKALAWNDLELIETKGNVPIGSDSKYRMDVTIPSDRSGDAILFVRWQRDDAAGEGFYNCSDITIANDEVPTEPSPEPAPDLERGDLFIPIDFISPEVGDIVNYDIIDKYGSVARSFQIEVNRSNIEDWDRLLASEINGWHAEYKDGAVFIGDWHEEMNHYMYFKDEPARNFFNSKDARASGKLSISDEEDNAPPLTGDIYELVSSDKVVNAGEHVILKMSEDANLTQTQGTPVNIVRDGSELFVVDTTAVTQTETLSFVANSVNSDSTATFTFEVHANEEPTPPAPGEPEGDEWSHTAIYLGDEIVTYAGSKWQAQWWIQGGDNPKMSYEEDQWGVWRPVN